ncbi:MAG: ribonucleoside-diphosphate reductase, adenosylcobalamin-dependent [Candidatus Liptonbacteria bacterium RIFCSPLOWO2_01_FULL_45_15]|uniref:Vitamin B12-dependent ribonucleotide reductase n=1 Tax=Candidatus Liptonbacteria bacterium RIFCSPLOWO2_01_FULL_45_15 TaxID=1798649 RepID=A0A1G2CGU1_9BACT|nr:MAG: ribonucleoside-diphosphate reductase, adenosylcobalamin-dependent [Candidatus Liptonbacteria bacterium RIFCSPLOWO2_01_FULL_45_15]
MMKKRYLAADENGKQENPSDMFHRVAHALSEVEKNYGHDARFVEKVEKDFWEILSSKEYTPAGRTLTNAGSGTPLVANCIVLPVLDSMESIFQTLKDSALLQQAGSGLGFDFSHLRPAMWPTKKSRGVSSGPVEFLRIYDTAFGIIKQQGRHGANMAMMEVTHPDILDFIGCKKVEGEIRNFNISVKVTDAFMKQLVENPDEQWLCEWNGQKMKPHKVLRAPNHAVIGVEDINITVKELFDQLVEHAWLNGEPGIVFIDEVNRTNPLPGLGPIDCSNPCGEQFLHHYDNCNLGSINLAEFVKDGRMDWNRLRRVTKISTRLMDDVIDLFDFPVQQVTDLARKNRRIGLGIMGFADMLYQLGVAYDSEEGRKIGEKVMKTITDSAHEMSRELAKEKGAFANWNMSVSAKKREPKRRNAALTTVAPTGSISMMLDVSSGIEPNFALSFVKQDKDGHKYHYFNSYFEKALSSQKFGKEKIKEIKEEIVKTGSIQSITDIPEKFKNTFVVSMDISADNHIKMQAAFQKNVDNSISKTINFTNSATREDVFNGFVEAWKMKCKACTVYRDGSREVQILNLGTGENIKAPSSIGAGGIKKAEEVHVDLAIDKNRLGARKRPEILVGKTYRIKTGYGNLYVTVNNDESGVPFEVFAVIGKSGGFFQEQSEGICRLISVALRAGVKLEEVIDNLKGIRGPMPMLTDKGTVLSLPDAIGQVLEQHVIANGYHHNPLLSEQKDTDQVVIQEKETAAVNVSHVSETTSKKSLADYGLMPGCPDCGEALIVSEGCMSCRSCGFSRCL